MEDQESHFKHEFDEEDPIHRHPLSGTWVGRWTNINFSLSCSRRIAMAVRAWRFSISIVVAAGLAIAIPSLLLRFSHKPSLDSRVSSPRLWSAEELSIYNGSDSALPILLAILGSVFDVTKGKSHYGQGGGYNHFSARDASRAFVSGNFTDDGLIDSLHGLSSPEVKSIVDWRDFYSRSYTFVGHLVGRYYNAQGERTKYLKGVEAKAARGAQLLEKQKKEEEKIPSCNSKWSPQDGGEVWCDVGYYPRLVERPIEIALTGKMSRRCACYKREEVEQLAGLQVYEGCDPISSACTV